MSILENAYNLPLKQEYVDEMSYRNTHLGIFLNCQFAKSESYEEKLGKDLCAFTVAEIIEYYKTLCLTSYETLAVLNSQFKIYTNWCMNRGMVPDNQNHYYEIINETIISCINTGLAYERIVTRNELLKILEGAYNSSDVFLALALFEGICGKEMCEFNALNMKAFSKDLTVKLNTGRILKISGKLYDTAEESANEYTYYTMSIRGGIREFKFREYDDSILKCMYNATMDGDVRQRLYNKLMRMKKNLGAECLTTASLTESGRIEMIRNLSKKESISFKEALIKHKEVEDIYGKVYSYSTFMLKYGDIIERLE